MERPGSDSTTLSHILGEDSELAEAVPNAERARAIKECVAETMELERGPWAPHKDPASGAGIGLLVQRGLLIRHVGIDGRSGAELLGEGDLLRPWQGEDAAATMPHVTGWRVLQATRLAVLDVDAARLLSRYPELTGQLVGRALERSRNLTINMAIVHHARVSTRLQMLLWHLADRWGRVRADGIWLPFRLTHEVLSDLVAARRPTVSSALGELGREGRLRLEPGGWILTGEPPGELLEIQDIEPRR
ncbi:MAG TPA: Crp/Fnr family transcriptional regulator [Solirubrobacteraceae bacterium]